MALAIQEDRQTDKGTDTWMVTGETILQYNPLPHEKYLGLSN